MARDDRITKGFPLDVVLHQLSAEIVAVQLSGGDANKMLIRWSTLLEEAKASIVNESVERLKDYMLQKKEKKEIPIYNYKNLLKHKFSVLFAQDPSHMYTRTMEELLKGQNIEEIRYIGDESCT